MDEMQVQALMEDLQSSMQADMEKKVESLRRNYESEIRELKEAIKHWEEWSRDQEELIDEQTEQKLAALEKIRVQEKKIQQLSSEISGLKKELRRKSEMLVTKSEKDLRVDEREMELTSQSEILEAKEENLISREKILKKRETTITSLETGVQASRNALEREKEEFKLVKDSLAHERACFYEEKKRYREQVAAAANDMIFAHELRRNSKVRNQMEQEAAEFQDWKSLLSAGYKIPYVLLLCYILVFTFDFMAPGTAFEEQIGFTFYIAWQCIRVIGLGMYYTALFPMYSGLWVPTDNWEMLIQAIVAAIILLGFVLIAVRTVKFAIVPLIKFWRDKKIFDLTTLAVLTVLMSLAAISTATINSFALAMGVFVLYIAIRSGCSYDWHTVREFMAILRGKKSQDA